MMQADTLILLSNINGIYTGNPNDPRSQLIMEVAPGTDLSEYIQTEKSSAGRGGMQSKYATASKIQQSGIRVIIANGKRENILINLIADKKNTPHTEFLPYKEQVG
jgi:glutamate 5-kinase